MAKILLSDQSPLHHKTDAHIFLLEQDFSISTLQHIAKQYNCSLQHLFEAAEFTGKEGSLFSVPVTVDSKPVLLLFVGLGAAKENKISVENMRRAVGRAVKAIQQKKINTATLSVPSAQRFGISTYEFIKQLAVIIHIASYFFDDYFSDESKKVNQDITFTLMVDMLNDEAKKGVDHGTIIGQAVNQVRHWIDLPPSTLTPPELAIKAEKIAKDHGLAITVFSEEEVNKMGMGGLAGVSAGSHQDCKLVIMEYKTQEKNAPTLAFVGKGITFDSGGLSLKPAAYMETMKDDMSGAAAVIGTMKVLAQLKPKVNVIGIAPLAENLPSGTATKPGDILRFYNGKTAEVKNTDAEGRLILADALSYAVKHYKPDAIIDVATLTGACLYALGPFFSGMMSQHDELVAKVQAAADRTGDRVWRLPLDDDYKKAIASTIADICNIGNEKYRAGAITAAFFLKEFVNDVPWVHLDIAGTAYSVPDIPYYSHGATGAGLRLLVDLAMNY